MEMTKREFMTAITQLDGPEVMPVEKLAELADYARDQIEKMEADAEKRKGHKTEKQLAEAAEKDAKAEEVAKEHLGTEPKTATDVMNELNAELEGDAEPYKVQAVSAMLRRAVKLGVANMQKVKIPKKGEQNGYTLVE